MLLGHITNTYMIGDLLKKIGTKINLSLFVFGAVLPDLIDKPIALMYHLPSRGVAHSFICQVIFFYPVYRLLNKWKTKILFIWSGALVHLIQDWPDPRNLLWPFWGEWILSGKISIFEKLYNYYILRQLPILWWLEIISLSYIVYFKIYRRNI